MATDTEKAMPIADASSQKGTAPELKRDDAIDDEILLEALGKKQVMQRNFNLWSLLGMCFCTSSTWEAMLGVMAQALTSGGSSSVVWGFVAAAIGALFMAASLSEFASIFPTSGGQYHWAAELSPPRYRSIISWYAGWITCWAWVLTVTGGVFSTAMQITAYITLCNPDFTVQPYQTSLIYIALITIFGLMNIFAIKGFHMLNLFGMGIHIIGFFAIFIALLVVAKDNYNSAEFVFTNFTNESGWSQDGVAWSIGLLASCLGFIGWDSSAHMAEEMKHASRDLPRAMLGSVAVSAVTTFPFMIAVMFSLGSIDDVINGVVGRLSPLAQILFNQSGSVVVAVAMNSFITVLGIASGPSCISACSRVIWSFARDNGLPAPFAHVNPKVIVPVNSIILSCVISGAIGLIYIGNQTAYYSISSGVTILLITSYGLPIAVNLLWGIKYLGLEKGPFSLGRWTFFVNAVSLAWIIYLIIFINFPTLMPVTAANMNYSVVVFGAVFFSSTVLWFVYGRKIYHGPVREVQATAVVDEVVKE